MTRFVTNQIRKIISEIISKLFTLCFSLQHGKIKEVRLVTYRNGTPKGLAYVEYDNEVFTLLFYVAF